MNRARDIGRILVVGNSNVDRSVYIERRLQQELDRAWGEDCFQVLSAGLDAVDGTALTPAIRRELAARGAFAESFGASHLSQEEFAGADLVLLTSRELLSPLADLDWIEPQKVFALVDFADYATLVAHEELATMSYSCGAAHLAETVVIANSMRRLQDSLADSDVNLPDPADGPKAFDDMVNRVEQALSQIMRLFEYQMVRV